MIRDCDGSKYPEHFKMFQRYAEMVLLVEFVKHAAGLGFGIHRMRGDGDENPGDAAVAAVCSFLGLDQRKLEAEADEIGKEMDMQAKGDEMIRRLLNDN